MVSLVVRLDEGIYVPAEVLLIVGGHVWFRLSDESRVSVEDAKVLMRYRSSTGHFVARLDQLNTRGTFDERSKVNVISESGGSFEAEVLNITSKAFDDPRYLVLAGGEVREVRQSDLLEFRNKMSPGDKGIFDV